MKKQGAVRTCLWCERQLKGRIDKKFCNDGCRSHFNNQQKTDDCSYVRQVNKLLFRNRAILKSLIPPGNELAKTTGEALGRRGFSFACFTHTLAHRNGTLYKFCYEFGYAAFEGDKYLLIRRIDKTL